MAEDSPIEWTNHTFNTWWGCQKVSPACDHCYAELLAKRFGFLVWGKDAPRRFFSDEHWEQPLRWQRRAEQLGIRYRVFCSSMAEIMEDRRDLDEHRERLFRLTAQTTLLDWQYLTKRPHNYGRFLPPAWLAKPLPHVWLGTTVESVAYTWRVDVLRQTPAAVRFLSVEPLLEDLAPQLDLSNIDWLILGGESGCGYRPMNLDWARNIRDLCGAHGVRFFYKQQGGIGHGTRVLDGRTHDDMPSPFPILK